MLNKMLAIMLLLSSFSFADIWHVATDGDDISGDGSQVSPYQTISTAVMNAGSGDIISIGAGTFIDNFNSSNKSISFIGTDSASTFITVDEALFAPSQTTTILLQDLKFGSNHSPDDLIIEATCDNCPVGDTVHVIIDRVAVDGGNDKRFMNAGNRAAVRISNSRFARSYSSSDHGSVIALESSSLFSTHSSFQDNASDVAGQVIFASSGSSIEMEFNSFSGNGANPGAIALSDGSGLTIKNSILWGTPNFQIVVLNAGADCSADIAYTNMANGQFGIDDQSGSLNLTWGAGNFNLNPQFASNETLQLLENSPCIDAGDPDWDDDGSDWTVDVDDQDPDGTRLDIGAFWFDQTDSLPPLIESFTQDMGDLVYNDQSVQIQWSASDDKTLDWAKLYFSSNEGASYDFQDSLAAQAGEINWVAPQIHASGCKLMLQIADAWGNVSSDTTLGFFSVSDTTRPQLSITQPTETTAILEGDTLHIHWDASDNVGLEQFVITLQPAPGEDSVPLDTLEASSDAYHAVMTTTPTDSAQIIITAIDVAGNQISRYSDYFSIVDNTPPEISLIRFSDPPFAIGTLLDIDVYADDNLDVATLDIAYGRGEDSSWVDIVTDLPFIHSRHTYQWTIPNIPGACRLRVIAYDAVALSDTLVTDSFDIDIIYPQMVLDDVVSSPSRDVYLLFSQVMESALGETSVRVDGTLGGSYAVDLSTLATSLTIHPVDGFVALDTLRIILEADQWSNGFGYGLDGNGNGSYEGSPADNDTIYSYVRAAGDFWLDGDLDFEDFDYFVAGWQSDRSELDLAPHTGSIPHIRVQGDGLIDIYDLATFAASWNWEASQQNRAPNTSDFSAGTIPTEQTGNILRLLPAGERLRSVQTIIEYDPAKVSLTLAPGSVAKVSQTALTLVNENFQAGYVVITRALDETSQDVELALTPRISEQYQIQVSQQMVSTSGEKFTRQSQIGIAPIPTAFNLAQNYPNPFNPSTRLTYACPRNTEVSLKIFNLLGQEIISLVDEPVSTGYHTVYWQGKDADQRAVPAGVYFAVFEAQNVIRVQKMLLLK